MNSRALSEPNRLRVDPQHERLLTCISCLALVCVGPYVDHIDAARFRCHSCRVEAA